MTRHRTIGSADLCLSLGFLLLIPASSERADKVAMEAVAKFGKNVDSGALLQSLILPYLLPTALALAVAGGCMILGLRLRVQAQWVAMVAAAAPFPLFLLAWLAD